MPFQRINGISMRIQMQGHGAPLLLLHGLGSCLDDWEASVPPLTRHFQIITCDLRGHGRSDKPPPPYTIPQLAADVASLLDQLKFTHVDVVGFSLGGIVAWQLAVDRPDLLHRLVVINASTDYRLNTWRRRLEAGLHYLIGRCLGMRMLGRWLARRLFPEPEQTPLRRAVVERLAGNDPRAYRATLRAIVGWHVTDRLVGISCPALVIASEHDYTPVEEHRRNAARLSNGSFRLIEHARHAWPLERPQDFVTLLEAFLRDAPNPATPP